MIGLRLASRGARIPIASSPVFTRTVTFASCRPTCVTFAFPATRPLSTQQPLPPPVRPLANTTTTTTTTTLPSTSTTTSSPPPRNPVSWHDYFLLRKSRKNWERAGALLGGVTGFVGGGYYFGAVMEFDPTQQLLGMPDPMMVYALGAVVVAAAASFAGILVGGQLWRLKTKRTIIQGLDACDREFFHRIQRNRPKEIAAATPIPFGSESQSGMPDYYGEKINSVADYRAWLKKQRMFNVTRSKRRDPIA
ncbi:hypothetical protein PhCBS80983_g06219 [Powellomyces hirtus]|uniref:Presequence translocated-associated motor subunit PAM17 n=1 Tax=Powellomyces hirtus TaxID=109895 RepID=A0A507DQK8_9FUNG|nr:hypothetical protein PhCBS80983_g06219 [Powellomyces hirtus]